LTEEKIAFVWFQVLTEILIQMPQLPTAKEEMLEEWRRACDIGHDDTKLINEFRSDYTPEQAIRWYTRNTFLYRSLNQALRSENIDNIYKFRLFIVDLHRQLTETFQSSVPTEQVLTVYRGQRMTKVEVEKLRNNLHGLISMNSFISTSVNETITRTFLKPKNQEQQETTVGVLFKMTLRNDIAQQTKKPFADIRKFSVYSHEEEILLSMGTVFRIDKIEQHPPDFYYFDLTMCTANIDHQVSIKRSYIHIYFLLFNTVLTTILNPYTRNILLSDPYSDEVQFQLRNKLISRFERFSVVFILASGTIRLYHKRNILFRENWLLHIWEVSRLYVLF